MGRALEDPQPGGTRVRTGRGRGGGWARAQGRRGRPPERARVRPGRGPCPWAGSARQRGRDAAASHADRLASTRALARRGGARWALPLMRRRHAPPGAPPRPAPRRPRSRRTGVGRGAEGLPQPGTCTRVAPSPTPTVSGRLDERPQGKGPGLKAPFGLGEAREPHSFALSRRLSKAGVRGSGRGPDFAAGGGGRRSSLPKRVLMGPVQVVNPRLTRPPLSETPQADTRPQRSSDSSWVSTSTVTLRPTRVPGSRCNTPSSPDPVTRSPDVPTTRHPPYATPLTRVDRRHPQRSPWTDRPWRAGRVLTVVQTVVTGR